MGFYIRKAIKVGPLRYNLSKSGIGVSAGVPGFRIGSGPRGNYVHMGRGGIYFRKSLGSLRSEKPSASGCVKQSPTEGDSYTAGGTVGAATEIESASVVEMGDSSSKELLAEINQKIVKVKFLPLAIILAIVSLGVATNNNLPSWLLIIIGIIGAALAILAYFWDETRCSVVMLYDFDKKQESSYSLFHDAFDKVCACEAIWHVSTSANVLDKKYHAGASHVISRRKTQPGKRLPRLLKTNIEVPVLEAGKQRMIFLPDRVLVVEPKSVGAVSYADLKIEVKPSRFIEEDVVTSDSEIVDQTWKYVNKSGSPDRRFSNNRQIPIVLYEEMHFTSPSGLNELFQLSKIGPAKIFSDSISDFTKAK